MAEPKLDTLLAHGLVEGPAGGAAPVVDRSTTFERWPLPPGTGGAYGRDHSPTTEAVEQLLGAVEEADALAFSSGMSAWMALCFATLAAGRTVAIPSSGYYGVEAASGDLLERFGVEVRRYDPASVPALAEAADGAALVLVETPANPTMIVVDISDAAGVVHAAGALLVVDNTFSTPVLQRPLDLGADLSWHSATKYLGGHSDVIAGVLATRTPSLLPRLRTVRGQTGTILAPDGAFLLHRGLRTLHLRVRRQSESALALARRLREHPAVTRVRYPGLEDDPGHAAALRQMRGGFGGMLAFEVADGVAAERVEDRLRRVLRATSLGGTETLIERRGRIEPEGRVPAGLLRLSVGLEDPQDVWADLEHALEAAPH
jgi:cystathionine gamma-synthase